MLFFNTKPKVIIADDDEYIRKFLKAICQEMKYKVCGEVEDADVLFDLINSKKPDILLLDINMPNLSGIDFLQNNYKQFPKTCIIVMTSVTSFQTLQDASELGIEAYIRKDLPVNKIMESITKTYNQFKNKNKNKS